MPSRQWYSQDRDSLGVPLDRVPLELFNTPASSLNSSVAQCQHNIKKWIEGVVKAVRTVQKFLRKQHFQGDHGLDQKVLKVIQPSPEVYVGLIEACPILGRFSPSFSELQRNFVKYKPTKLKSLLQLVKHWYLEYVKAQCPRAVLPPMYALELLTVYAWETGTKESKRFRLDKGLVTVLQLLIEYQRLCISWTKYYTLQNPIIEDFVRNQLKEKRPIILDPADPTYNVATGHRWDIVAQSARCCLKQYCCYDFPNWKLKFARDFKVTVDQWGHVDFIIQVNPYESMQELGEKIQCKLESSAPQRLSFQGLVGSDRPSGTSPPWQLTVSSLTLASLLQTFPPQMQVFVNNHRGGSHAYAIYSSSLVLGLKCQIEVREGLLRKKQQLEFQGQVLQDEWSLSCYGVRDNTTLILSKKTVG